jgi:hypothetical protein
MQEVACPSSFSPTVLSTKTTAAIFLGMRGVNYLSTPPSPAPTHNTGSIRTVCHWFHGHFREVFRQI